MASNHCQDYERVGYCLKGGGCTQKHGNDLIELDISGYQGLIEAKRAALSAAAAQTREQQNELARKETDLLSNLVSQQKALIKKIEMCTDETEKMRLKSVLNEMTQKTKEWMEKGGTSRSRPAPAANAAAASGSSKQQTSSDANQKEPSTATATVRRQPSSSKEL